MKKCLALLLACALLLTCGCTAAEGQGSAGKTYVNPLNGEFLDQPYMGRIFACSINNIQNAIPHVGVIYADIYMEMFVNNSVIRGLALYTDIASVEAIGGIRSNRLMFNDIVTHYDAVTIHSGASNTVINATAAAGVDNYNIDQWYPSQAGASYRDKTYGRVYENTLFGVGQGIVDYANAKGTRVANLAGKNYNLVFVDDGTPTGETAAEVKVTFSYGGSKKETIMKYDETAGKYVYYQYGQKMVDQITGEDESFTNVIIMNTRISMSGKYHVADFVAGGDGYYANGGQLIPITWTCEAENKPFAFWTGDGEPLEMGRGNTYIAIAPVGSPVSWQ